jgi:hypothetical protein
VGVFEEEDDDIYDSIDHQELGMSKSAYSWGAKEEEHEVKSKKEDTLPGMLAGFCPATVPDETFEYFEGPTIPQDWVPRPPTLDTPSAPSTQLNPDQRRDILGEDKLAGPPPSVFSMLSASAQERVQNVMERARGEETLDSATAKQALTGYIPFENDPAKKQRYISFLKFCAGDMEKPQPPPPVSDEYEFISSI